MVSGGDTMLEFIQMILVLVKIVPWLVMGASAVAALTPTPKDDEGIAKYYKVIDWFALNIGNAKEK